MVVDECDIWKTGKGAGTGVSTCTGTGFGTAMGYGVGTGKGSGRSTNTGRSTKTTFSVWISLPRGPPWEEEHAWVAMRSTTNAMNCRMLSMLPAGGMATCEVEDDASRALSVGGLIAEEVGIAGTVTQVLAGASEGALLWG